MKFNYEITKVDVENKVMEVTYTAENETSISASMPIPRDDENINELLLSYSPVNYWERKAAAVQTVAVGTTGEIWSEHPTETKAEYDARIAAEVEASA